MMLPQLLKLKYQDIRNPKPIVPSGAWMYVASPLADDVTGSGKTLSCIERLDRTESMYDVPVHIFTNCNYVNQDGAIEKMEDITEAPPNSIFLIDEAPTWFNSRYWQKFPLTMFASLAQNRKMNKQFLMTAQVFDHADKNFRDFARIIVECRMSWGNRVVHQCAFRSRDYKKIEDSLDDDFVADRVVWKHKFLATDELFAQYDTNYVVKQLQKMNEKE